MADEPRPPCPAGCRDHADPERRVLELLECCSPAFLYWLRTDGIGRVMREKKGFTPTGEVGTNVVSRV